MTGIGKEFLRGLLFTPAECYVNRIVMRPISALQRIKGVDNDRDRDPGNVECYLIEHANVLIGIILSASNTLVPQTVSLRITF